MNTPRMTLSVVLFVSAFALLVAAETKADPRENLETAIPEAIRLLEAKDYAGFLKAFIAPDDLKIIIERGSFNDNVTVLSQKKAAPLLEMLRAIQNRKPELDASGTKAAYKLQPPIDGKSKVSFVKVDKSWYIHN